MATKDRHYTLIKDIERYLAALAALYKQEGERQKLEIIANAKVRIVEEWSYDNWNGGTAGHALFLRLPKAIYLSSARQRHEIRKEIQSDFNQVHNVQNEFIQEVFLELDEPSETGDRRMASGVQLKPRPSVADATQRLILSGDHYRVFFSHKSEVKRQTSDLKAGLEEYGISAFVAHTRISTRRWTGREKLRWRSIQWKRL